jgi:hypothetical protein
MEFVSTLIQSASKCEKQLINLFGIKIHKRRRLFEVTIENYDTRRAKTS